MKKKCIDCEKNLHKCNIKVKIISIFVTKIIYKSIINKNLVNVKSKFIL